MKAILFSYVLLMLVSSNKLCNGVCGTTYAIPPRAWWARDISSSYSDFFHRAKTKEDGTYSTNDNLWPFGVLNTEGYKSKYFFGDLTTRYTDFPTITLSSVKFELYTPDSQLKPERFTLLNVYRMRTSHFNKRRPTKIIIHPYNSFPNYEVYVRMRKAYVQHLRANVLVVNWLSTALSVSYVRTAIRAQRVASIIARFVDSIPPTPEIHFIGTSMAVHVSGSASRLMKRNVERITGLDPAGPIYSTFPSSYLLNPGDADFVDVIHTDAGLPKYGHFGINRSLGHVDFYVNGGRNQPGCGRTASALVGYCSHFKSAKYFTDTIQGSQYIAYPCSPKQAIYGFDRIIPFGEFAPKSARGIYCTAIDRPEDRTPKKRKFQLAKEAFPGFDMRSIIF